MERKRQGVQNKHCPSREGQSKLRGAAQVFPYPVTRSSWPQHRAWASLACPGSVRASEQKCLDTTWFTENNSAITCSTLRWGCSCKKHFWLCLKKKKKKNQKNNRSTSLCHWDKPPTWKASNFGSTPQQGGYWGPMAITGKLDQSCFIWEKVYILMQWTYDKLLPPLLNTQPVGTRNDLLHPTSWSLTSEHSYFLLYKKIFSGTTARRYF